MPQNKTGFLLEFFVLVVPCILPVIDRLPKQIGAQSLAASAWRWSFYSWGVFLIASHYLDPNSFGQLVLGTLVCGLVLLVPFFKWRNCISAIRQALQPHLGCLGLQSSLSSSTPHCSSPCLLFPGPPPSLFKQEAATAITFGTNSTGWVVRTATDKSKLDGKVIEVSYFQPASSSEGYFRGVVKHDRSGHPVEGLYLDLTGKPIATTCGYQRWTASYSAKGEQVSLDWL